LDELVKYRFCEKVFADRNGFISFLDADRNCFTHRPSFQQRDYPRPVLEAFRLLLELRFSFWKGKPFVYLSDEAGVLDAVNGGHEISDGLRAVNGIHLPCGFAGFFRFAFGYPDKMPAEIVREKEILLQKEEIGIDVEETKSNHPSIQRFKGERHENSLQKWTPEMDV
jgi:hypothetical protein